MYDNCFLEKKVHKLTAIICQMMQVAFWYTEQINVKPDERTNQSTWKQYSEKICLHIKVNTK